MKGRPPIPAELRHSQLMQIRLTQAERDQLVALVTRLDITISDLVRGLIAERAKAA